MLSPYISLSFHFGGPAVALLVGMVLLCNILALARRPLEALARRLGADTAAGRKGSALGSSVSQPDVPTDEHIGVDEETLRRLISSP